MPFKICETNHEYGRMSYVNEETTTPEDGWTTTVPTILREVEKLVEEPTPPKIFETRKEAKPYLDAVRQGWLEDWEKNRWFYKSRGFRKPQWKICEV